MYNVFYRQQGNALALPVGNVSYHQPTMLDHLIQSLCRKIASTFATVDNGVVLVYRAEFRRGYRD